MNIRNWIVWGAGQIGQSICRLLKNKNCKVLAFIDMNEKMHGKVLEGVKVHSKKDLALFQDYTVCVSVDGKYDEIAHTLMDEFGLEKERIISHVSLVREVYMKNIDVPPRSGNAEPSIIFQCDSGLGLGGVETWCLTFGKELERKGVNVKYLVPKSKENSQLCPQKLIEVECEDFLNFGNPETFENLIQALVDALPCTVVINYKFLGYLASCIVKQAYPEDIRLISVVHGGKQPIFDWNVMYQDYIDGFVGVARGGICDKLIANGIPSNKVANIVCPVPIEGSLERAYSKDNEPMKLSYAGRLTLKDSDKRVDLLIPFIEGLEQSKVNYILHIAGDGDYRPTLEEYVNNNNLQERIIIHGLIPRDSMKQYWKQSDVFVNVSDSEGNCMSMLEALSQGCVPVLTDVSGVRDSVEDGENGYIVERRDIDTMVRHIKYLDEHRPLLEIFGRRSYAKMYEKYGDGKMVNKFLDILLG